MHCRPGACGHIGSELMIMMMIIMMIICNDNDDDEIVHCRPGAGGHIGSELLPAAGIQQHQDLGHGEAGPAPGGAGGQAEDRQTAGA